MATRRDILALGTTAALALIAKAAEAFDAHQPSRSSP